MTPLIFAALTGCHLFEDPSIDATGRAPKAQADTGQGDDVGADPEDSTDGVDGVDTGGGDTDAGYSARDYVSDRYTLTCALMFSCYDDPEDFGWGDDAQACHDSMLESWDERDAKGDFDACSFDEDAALACVGEFRELTCDVYLDGYVPQVCNEVCSA